MDEEDVFSLPPPRGILLVGPDIFELEKDVILKSGTRLDTKKAIILFRGENNDQ